GFGDLVVGNRIVAGNIARTHDTGDVQHAQLVVHAHFLRSTDNEIAVGQRIGDDGRDLQADIFATFDGALALRLTVGMGVDRSIHVAASSRACNAAGRKRTARTINALRYTLAIRLV